MPVPNNATQPETPSAAADLTRRRRIPAWLMSAAFHTLFIVTLALTIRIAPQGGSGEEPGRGVGVVLAKATEGKTEYFDEAAQQNQASHSSESQSAASVVNPFPTDEELPTDLGGVLPASDELVGSGSTGEFLPSAEELTQGTRVGKQFGGGAKTQVFGLQGEGSKFVYVFDRSGSMSGYGGRPLRSAKSELIGSLGDLERTHQFQIIFYNEKPRPFTLDGRTPRLVWGDEQGKTLAQRFVKSILAAGGTRHMEPLMIALKMGPDVIFFLTDAEEPRLSADELARIRRANKGTQIHAIEFGFGPAESDDNFLRRLARQNGGQHAYIDISKLPD